MFKIYMKKLLFFSLVLFISQFANGQSVKESFDDSIRNQIHYLDSLTLYNFEIGQDSLARSLCLKSIDLKKKEFGESSLEHASSLSILAEILLDMDNDKEALCYANEALQMRKDISGINSAEYVNSLNVLTEINYCLSKYDEAKKYCNEAYMISKKALGHKHPEYARALNSVALVNCAEGNYTNAVLFGQEAMALRKVLLGTDHPDYFQSLSNLAAFNAFSGNYMDAIRLGKEVSLLLKKKYGNMHMDYAESINNVGFYYTQIGGYEEAIRLFEESAEIQKTIMGIDNSRYALSLNNIAFCKSELGKSKEAIQVGEEALEIYLNLYGTESEGYEMALLNLAAYYNEIGNYNKAINLATDAKVLCQKIYGERHPEYAIVLSNLAKFYYLKGEINKAYLLSKEELDIRRETLGEQHPDYLKSLQSFSFYCNKLGKISSSYQNEREAIDKLYTHIRSNFAQMFSYKRNRYWNLHSNEFCYYYPSLVYQYQTAESISDLYNKSALFAKGILLNTDIEMKKIITESGDSILLNNYLDLLSYQDHYNKLIETPLAERKTDKDSLHLMILTLEKELVKASKVYGDYTHNLRVTWQNIQNHLQPEDVAIEFLDFPIGTDSVLYVALTLRKDYETPKMTVLFEEKQLKQIPDTLYFQCKEMSNLVWGPLLPELQGINNVYFSPSGVLHTIGIEYLLGMENYNLFRLSSTRELVVKKENISTDCAVLYGGLDYYSNIDTIGHNSQSALDYKYVEHANIRGMKLRGGKEYLPHTKEEVEQIAKQLCKANWSCQLDTLDKGTETSFKSLSGEKVNTLHISTHGFYYTPDEADKMGYDFLRLDNHMASAEDKSLTRSGLILSGANHILEGEKLPENVEDGILTAKEIADLDLRGLDLVVLSACQTGLGDISQGEGVFGLQRGFKKAGANSILMSLWEVEDEATQILMTQFYKNLVSGQSKRQSLRSAQKYLREYNNGCYHEPKYWAAFILLDGIEKN